jgi:rod shape-determining protein MreC
MSARTAQQRAPGVLAVLLLLQLILMSTSARHPNTEQSMLSNWAMAVLIPLVQAGDKVISGVVGSFKSVGELREARRENADLKTEIERLRAELDQAREHSIQFERLQNQLGLPISPDYPKLAANVVSRQASVWFRHLVIDRGSLDGVKLSMPVATAHGIVGRVIETGPNYARVQLITDKYAGVGAMIQRSAAMGELRGLDEKSSRCALKNVPSTETVEIGDAVVTTGLDGIYPKGLSVGAVESVEIDPNGPWHRVIVRPAAPVDRLEQVFVLFVEQKDLRMTETIK